MQKMDKRNIKTIACLCLESALDLLQLIEISNGHYVRTVRIRGNVVQLRLRYTTANTNGEDVDAKLVSIVGFLDRFGVVVGISVGKDNGKVGNVRSVSIGSSEHFAVHGIHCIPCVGTTTLVSYFVQSG